MRFRPDILDPLIERLERDRLGKPILAHLRWARGETRSLIRQSGVDGSVLVGAAVAFLSAYCLIAGLTGPQRHLESARGSTILPLERINLQLTFQPTAAIADVSPIAIKPQLPQPEPPPVVQQAPVIKPKPESERLEDEFEAAKQRCLDQLLETPAYRKAEEDIVRLEWRLKMLRLKDPSHELPQTSAEWIQAKGVVNRMTNNALAVDPDVSRIQQRMLDLGIIKRGRAIYVFESGDAHDKPIISTTQP